MPYTIKTKDGITVAGIPDDVAKDDARLRELVAQLRASGQTSGTFAAPAAPAEAVPEAPPAAPQMGVAETAVRELPQNLGVAARGVAQGLAGPVTMLADPITRLINLALPPEAQQLPPSEGLSLILTKLGVPEAQTKAQEILQAASAGMGGAGAETMVGRALAAAPGVIGGAQGLVGGVGRALASGPAQNLAGGAAGGAAAEVARQQGASPALQMGAGLAGGLIGGGLASKTLDAPPVGPVAEAEAAGVRLMTSDVVPPKTFASKWLRSMGEKIPVAGTGPVRQAQQAERVAAVRDLVRQYGAEDLNAATDDVVRDLFAKRADDLGRLTKMKGEVIEKLSAPQLIPAIKVDGTVYTGSHHAEAIQKALDSGKLIQTASGFESASGAILPRDWADLFIDKNNKLYNRFQASEAFDISASESFAKHIVPMPATVAKIDESIARLQGLKTAQVKPVIAVLEDWKQAIEGQNLANIEDLRKQIGEVFKAPEMASVRSTGEKVLSGIYGAVKDDMTEYIKAAGGPADLNKWQVANRELSKMAGELDLPAMKSVLERGEATPEVVKTLLFSSKRSDVQALYRNLSDTGKAAARSAVLARAAEKAGEELSPDRFATAVKKMGDQVGVFFTGEDLKQVQGLVRVLDYTKRAADAAVMPPTGVQLAIPAAATALGQVFGPGLEGFVGSAASLAAAGGAARLYESKAVRNLLMQLPQLKPGSPEEAALLKRLLTAAYVVQRQESPKAAPAGAPARKE